MKKVADIRDKLAYVLLEYKNLQTEISLSQKEERDFNYIGHKVGDILGNCRKCYDYCAMDIFETFVQSGKESQVYFCFKPEQLNGDRNPLSKLSSINPALHSHLLGITTKIKDETVIPDTIFHHGTAMALNEIVNHDKHREVTKTLQKENSATNISFANGTSVTVSPCFKFDGELPNFSEEYEAMQMVGSDGVEIKYVKEYKLSFNNWEVSRFCLHSLQITSHILSEIYQKFFGVPPEQLDPWETIKPEKQKKAESILKDISPIANRPLRIVLFMNEREVVNCEFDFDGKPLSNNLTDIAIANLFLIIYENYYLVQIQSQNNNFVLENAENFDTSDTALRYLESEHKLQNTKEILVNNGEKISFNALLWGIGSKFRCPTAQKQSNLSPLTISSAVSIVASTATSFNLTTNTAGDVVDCIILQ